MDIRFAAATPADEPAIRALLKNAGLPHDDFAAHLSSFITAKEGDTLIGTIGMEVYDGGAALIRSPPPGEAPVSAAHSTPASNNRRAAAVWKPSICLRKPPKNFLRHAVTVPSRVKKLPPHCGKQANLPCCAP